MDAEQLLVFVLVTTVFLSILFTYACLRSRDRRGATALAVLFVGVILWVVSEIIQMQTGPSPNAWGGMAIRLVGVEMTALGIFLLGLEYTGREQYINRWVLGLLAIEPVMVVSLAVSPYQHLLFGIEATANSPWGYEVIQTPLWMGHVLYSYLLVVIGLVLLAHMMIRAEFGYRRQLFAIVVALLVPFAGNALFQIGIVTLDLTPAAFFVTAVVLTFAAFRLRLFDTIPVARRTVLEEMKDPVFVLDERGRITTVNDAAIRTFGAESGLLNTPVEDVLDDETLADPAIESEQELERVVDGEVKHFDVTKSVLTDYRDNVLAQVLVCRDVTEQRRREEQLELLKDVQSRFLRHNLRNELNTILSHADLMTRDDGPTQAESYEKIDEATGRLVEWGEKARTIERLVETTDRMRYDCTRELEYVVESVEARHPHVEFQTEFESPAWIQTVPQVDSAFENLLDNAARYNTSDGPYVHVSVDVDDIVTIRIEDNGPGIDREELHAIQSREETQLEHGSGFGLWLAYWVVEKSGGEIEFESQDGTTVTLTFESVDPPRPDGLTREEARGPTNQ